jgi:anti-anti-sigma factor
MDAQPAAHLAVDVAEAGEGRVTVALRGELDIATSVAVAERLAALRGRRVVIDLRRLTFIDSSGMHVLLRACRGAAATGASVRLRRPPRRVMRTFELVGLADVLPFVE